MSRVAAPVTKISRSILESQRHAGASIMPKYEELLRSNDKPSDSSRHLYTTHRPTPQPSIANRPKPLMQTFYSTATVSQTPATHLDATVLPRIHATVPLSEDMPRVPLLPDNYGAYYAQETETGSNTTATIVATNPENVVPGAPMAAVEGVNIDGVELKFAHEQPQEQDTDSTLGSLWRSMVDDVFGNPKAKSA